jgi:hypothetical protein
MAILRMKNGDACEIEIEKLGNFVDPLHKRKVEETMTVNWVSEMPKDFIVNHEAQV